jgi:hypothetical protein
LREASLEALSEDVSRPLRMFQEAMRTWTAGAGAGERNRRSAGRTARENAAAGKNRRRGFMARKL